MTNMNRALIVTGMHRSGTSLIANWLGVAGLSIGSRLIGATPSNVLGHFEDVEIVEFHENLLRFNNTNLYQGIGSPLLFNEDHLKKAKEIISVRNQTTQYWGWKQPRAALFFPLWQQVLPEQAYFIFPFRSYQEVVNSLYNREFNKITLRNPPEIAIKKKLVFLESKQKICNNYLSMWIRHNTEIINYTNQIKQNKFILISLENFLKSSEDIFKVIKEKWQFENLISPDINQIYQSKILSKVKQKLSFCHHLQKQADEVTKNLADIELRNL